jgi:N-methylhydantoinase A/oxoprolinase/acetone carboxylase beta subunit
VVPPRAGVLSAAGILAAPVARELVRTWPVPSSHDGLSEARAALGREVGELVGRRAVVETVLDCRYPGQSHELTVPEVGDFPGEHERVNGHRRPGSPVEVVALRARASLPSGVSVLDLPVPAGRSAAKGPDVIAEPDCTIWLPEGWQATVGEVGALLLRRTP